jgi:F420-dependent methylenetetrahydromethanopterin dehydrogenase
MTHEQSLLQIGIVDFADPTLLLIGEPYSMHRLADEIASRQEFEITVGRSQVRLRFVPIELSDDRLTRKDSEFVWYISAAKAQEVEKVLRGLATSTVPAHAYLDPEQNLANVEVVASIGEYKPEQMFPV